MKLNVTLGCTNVINAHILTHTLSRTGITLVLPNRISGQAYDYTQLSEVILPTWQSYRKHNEAIKFGERSFKAFGPTGWVSTLHTFTALKLLAAWCDPRSVARCGSRCNASWLDGFLNGLLNAAAFPRWALRRVLTLYDTFKCIQWPLTGVISYQSWIVLTELTSGKTEGPDLSQLDVLVLNCNFCRHFKLCG